jgi:hypothetical protein
MRRSIVMRSRATTGRVRPNVKENGQLRPSNAIPDAWKAGSRPYLEFGLQASSENAYPRASSGGIWGIPAEIASCLHLGESRLLNLGDGQAFLHVLTPPLRLVIVGATHVGQVLADLATRIGYDVVIVDPRTAFASQERIGETMAFTDWPEISLSLGAQYRRSARVSRFVVIVHVQKSNWRRWRSPKTMIWSRHSRRNQSAGRPRSLRWHIYLFLY